ncbi:tRNA preQ1(34) S-adenosylmethionine ribosyltransferase-isomerase QueA [Halorhodospira halophila]|uniref:S-adenosylmethionine:tRNA ribosyltransferase-isomerase n=1 Tax=Halorhodospira halophila (strain DSM 244 / SL1) TaxID=349124 RepID=A1WXR5_HALHL|nr:tRNA preQ1(34) S-adenosylmethionine ribosyltransferase-isomerase QueA [Halorhodospira halophila]ABM62477.1 S-adenosylmethionine--tRNA-ribosyltransferase-isomerase [Halorhodospira halophila SL1]MBK1728156.1 tRNA preQ1(34) S-adenosylmethionine ribosyltransferase-isomerase QueA [Halorhodospira halophila]
MTEWRRSDFDYALPERLIAHRPAAQRAASRMLVLRTDSGALADRRFTDLPAYLRAGDLLVLNDTRVIPARLEAAKPTGARVEVLIERVEDPDAGLITCQLRANRTPKPGGRLGLADGVQAEVLEREGRFFRLQLAGLVESLWDYLERVGHVPLPPYIRRPDDDEDRTRYQTVFAARPGAVAAPTAGLHFDDALLERLRADGVGTARVTLHVGAGTFAPVESDDLSAHTMHAEWLEVSAETVAAVNATRERGGRVVAVGTTVVRALESAAADGQLAPYSGETRLFITPGYCFRAVDGLLTNFHLPESTLLMLVSAFGGYESVMAAYRHAVAEEYRFFSYGDAMLLI